MRVDDRAQRPREAGLDGRARRLAELELLPDALEDQDVRVDGHAHGERDAGQAGQRQGGAERRHAREEDQEVQAERDVGDEPRHPVVEEHEHEDHRGRRGDREEALADRVSAERRAHRSFLEDHHRRRQRARAQDDGEVARFLDGELAGDDGAAAGNTLVDPGGRIHVAIEDDGQMLANVLLSDLAENPGAHRVELDGDLPVARRVGIRLHLGTVQLGTRQQRALLDHVRHLALDLRLLVDPSLVEELRSLGQPSGLGVLHRRPLIEQLELEQRRLADQGLGPFGILNTRQLDQDAVLALTGDGRLGHAELIHAIADRLDALAHGEIGQPLDLGIGEHELEGPGGRVLVAAQEPSELVRRGQRVVPVLGRGELDGDRGTALAGDAGNADALALEGGLQILGRPIGLAGDGLVGLHAQDQMDASLEVEAEVDRFLRRVEVPERPQDDDGNDRDPDPDPSRHLSPPSFPP